MSESSFDHQKNSPNVVAEGQEGSPLDEAEVFANALDFVDVEARNRYLDQTIGVQSAQRKRLEKLIHYSTSTSDFLESSATATSPVEATNIESVGDWLGPYRLLEQIGEGGMGTVFMAEQNSPLQRRVAIKVIKPGMDSSQVLARFEAERQVLAMMEHPNIARAIDVGVSSFGRTYFVMELVKGIPITRYCDDLRLNTRQRLELFIPVCLAIQHAHQKGIIHRDLKPSNVLVAEYDGVAVPKIIDFGVSKALHQQLACKTLFTQFGQIVGTMEYMSPEQSRVNQLDIDTRSDIYSLGVLLYELITGTTPIQSQQLKDLGWDELARLIREEDAPAPSQRLSNIERIQLVAQQRNTEPSQLNGFVKGELDWIVLKALDKQRSRRYQNATELADDVKRFLRGDQVLACPPSTTYRIRKFIHKHKFSLLAGCLLSTAIVLGLAGTSWQAWQARTARHQAEKQRDIANAETLRAQKAQAIAIEEAAKSEKEAQITRAVANFVNNDLIAFADPNLEPNRNIKLREILDRASQKVASLREAPLVEASIRFMLAKSYLGLGEYRIALEHAKESYHTRAKELSQTNRESLASLLLVAEAQLKLSQFREACATYHHAMETSQLFALEQPTIQLDCQHGYGIAIAKLGKLDEATRTLKEVAERRRQILGATHVETLDTDRELAQLLFQKGLYREAADALKRSLEIMLEHLGDSHPLTLKTMADAANVAAELGESEEARQKRELILARQTFVLGEDHPDTLLTASNLTLVTPRNAKVESATATNQRLLQVALKKLGPTHAVSLSIASTLAEILNEYGQSKEAAKHLLACQTALRESHETTTPELLRIHCQLAGCFAFDGQYQKALELYQQTLEDQRKLLSDIHLDTLRTEFGLGLTLMATGDFLRAEKQLLQLIDSAKSADLKLHPIVHMAESRLATLENVLGRPSSIQRHQTTKKDALRKYGNDSLICLQIDVALAESLIRFGRFQEAREVLESGLATLNSQEGPYVLLRGQFHDALIEALVGNHEFTTAAMLSQKLYLERKASLGVQHPLTIRCQNQLGVVLVSSGNPQRGALLIREAMQESRKHLGPNFPSTLNYQQNLASTLGLLSVKDRSKRRETLRLFEELLSIQKSWGVDHPDWLFSQLGYAGALGQQGRFLQAEQVFQELLPKLIATYGESHPFVLRCRENYSSILGSLAKYPEAITQCRAYLGAETVSLPAKRKMTHAAIEYSILAGEIATELDLFESAHQLTPETPTELDWLYYDTPILVDALVTIGASDKANKFLRNTFQLLSEKLGRQHPKTQYLGAKLLALSLRQGQVDEASSLLKELIPPDQLNTDTSVHSYAKAMADIAERSSSEQNLHLVSLYAMAAQACIDQMKPQSTVGLDREYGIESKDSTDPSHLQAEADKYQESAIKALTVCAEKGMIQSPRNQHWVKYSRDLEVLRNREDFQHMLQEVEMATKIEKVLKFAWNLATIDKTLEAEHEMARFKKSHPDVADLGAVHYLSARVWAACYESAIRQNFTDQAAEFLSECSSSLDRCFEKGYLSTPENRATLATDDSFESVREQIANFTKYSSEE